MQSTFLNKDPAKTVDVVLSVEMGLSVEILIAWQAIAKLLFCFNLITKNGIYEVRIFEWSEF